MSTFLQQSPVVIATILGIAAFVVVVFLGWVISKKLEIKLGAFYNLFSAFLGIYVWLGLVAEYGFLSSWDMEIFLHAYAGILIFLGIWYLRKVFSIVVWDWYLTEYRKMQVPALVRSLVTVLILIVTILLIIRYVFDQDLSGLLVASSVVAAVIAFALQDFLGGLIAGISLNIQPPFEVGDWIRVIDKEGEVVDVNWRATTLRTLDRTYLVVPNSIITKEDIVNFYEPTRLHALKLSVGVEYNAPPSLVKDTFISCAVDTDGIRNKPYPQCRLTNFGDFAITYTLKCYIDDHTLHEEIRDGIMTRIWYALKREGIKIPFPIRDVYTHEQSDSDKEFNREEQKKEDYLRRADIFEPIEDEDIQMLVSSGKHWFYGRRERIVKQAESGDSLFLILEGSASVYVKVSESGKEVNVGRLGTGDFFGEKSLLTGEPRGASVEAETDIEVVEIKKASLFPILEKNPGIMEELSERLADRQLVNEGFFEEVKEEQEMEEVRANYSDKFLRGMKVFFGL